VFAPAGTASGAVEAMPSTGGDCVRVVGTVDVYQGDTEIQFFETEQMQVLTPTCVHQPVA
jgi:DNA/RNA endonuclease YhcR with UshA esterase domain